MIVVQEFDGVSSGIKKTFRMECCRSKGLESFKEPDLARYILVFQNISIRRGE